jgi:hypothetical protein
MSDKVEEIRQKRKEKFNYEQRQRSPNDIPDPDHPANNLDEGYEYPYELRLFDIKRQAKPRWKWGFRISSIVSVYSGLVTTILHPETSTAGAMGGLIALLGVILVWLLVFTKPIYTHQFDDDEFDDA